MVIARLGFGSREFMNYLFFTALGFPVFDSTKNYGAHPDFAKRLDLSVGTEATCVV